MRRPGGSRGAGSEREAGAPQPGRRRWSAPGRPRLGRGTAAAGANRFRATRASISGRRKYTARPQRSGRPPRTTTNASSARTSCRISSAPISARPSSERLSLRPELVAARPPRRTGALAAAGRHHPVPAADRGQLPRRLRVLHRGVHPPRGRVVPGARALPAPLLDQLPGRLVEQQQRQPVLAAGVAGRLERAHRPEAGRLVEQEQDAARAPARRPRRPRSAARRRPPGRARACSAAP